LLVEKEGTVIVEYKKKEWEKNKKNMRITSVYRAHVCDAIVVL
jgi:hypothetical protein